MAAETLILEAPTPPPSKLWRLLPVSIALHTALLLILGGDRPRPSPPQQPIDFEVVHVEPPPPPPPPAPPEVLPAEKPHPHPTIMKPPESKQEPLPPPPPNAPPPPSTPPAPIRIGISLESTTTGGGVAVGTGNTLYGKPDTVAGDPSEAQGYAEPDPQKRAFVPASQLTAMPRVLREPPHDYPEELRKSGFEGPVTLRIRIDATGKITSVTVVDGPGHGLNEVARRALFQSLWAPGMYQGRPVATEISYTYTFILE